MSCLSLFLDRILLCLSQYLLLTGEPRIIILRYFSPDIILSLFCCCLLQLWRYLFWIFRFMSIISNCCCCYSTFLQMGRVNFLALQLIVFTIQHFCWLCILRYDSHMFGKGSLVADSGGEFILSWLIYFILIWCYNYLCVFMSWIDSDIITIDNIFYWI